MSDFDASSSARASRAARRRGCTRSAARAWRWSRSAPTSTPIRPSARTSSSPARRRRSRSSGSRRSSRSTAPCATPSICGRRTAGGSVRGDGRPTATTSPARCSIRSCAASPPRRRASSSWRAPRRPSCWTTGATAWWSRIAIARAALCARAWWSPPTGATRTSRGWPACAGGCARTTASSTGPTGAGCGRPTTARGCGSWSPTAPTCSPTRTGAVSWPCRRTATACPSSDPTSRART